MPLSNTADSYGSVSRALHWLTAALVLTAIPLGLVANAMPFATGAELAAKAQVFSLHKTLGLAAFATACLRILWALTQTRPAPLHPERRAETFLAGVVHWALYAGLVLVPLSGWAHHAATEGFAPILWPFGQSLPLVPKDPAVAATFGRLHWLSTKVLAAAVVLHVAGALRHALRDRDGTLARMWSGRPAAPPAPARHPRAPALAAALLWLAALGLGLALVPRAETAAPSAPAAAAGGWTVREGTLGIAVRQMGAEVRGSFGSWTARIDFDPATGLGAVDATVDVGSLTLGSVTDHALGPEFLDAAAHPAATFSGAIRPEGAGHVAEGTLRLRGTEVPLTLPFALALEGDVARASGAVLLDRRAFGIGRAFPDEGQLGFTVRVEVALAAERAD
ncbi:MAG: cytochrome b/b6 domain-containing protein [Rhodobacteraceae bacterium]|nr:cytochrome b/b6 domain-containing protein [Paracoccaceae bacterium]